MDELSFRLFAGAMSKLNENVSTNKKCELSLNLYDLNNDKLINKNELGVSLGLQFYVIYHLQRQNILNKLYM